MSNGRKDKLKGALHMAKGKLKEVAGKVTDNPKLEAKGVVQQIAGKVQQKIGQIKTVIGKD